MGDGNGECCIARWGDSHVTSGYNTSKMDMIMLKFRPIAPKPVSGNIAVGEAASQSNGGRHAKGATGSGRGRRKSSKENNNNNNNSTGGSGSGSGNRRCNNNGRKRKSSSPDHQKNDEKTDLTLLPLFPEAPDLSPSNTPKNNNQVHSNNNSNMPFSLNFNFDDQIVSSTSFSFENNYNQCHSSWW
ncbi:uncharacterized protein LOC104883456 [Beta vulgaris subsp. vulgaris]|uniref:uncharacterized protein LOC104883456 n=1 Tax=Beta vulgaris subsp. vulgaris TaxID=3555 RepID=UPI00203720BE|nr:uncharacterized protein LOC104883456 [Beta vulgaris subsp. vulgaris]